MLDRWCYPRSSFCLLLGFSRNQRGERLEVGGGSELIGFAATAFAEHVAAETCHPFGFVLAYPLLDLVVLVFLGHPLLCYCHIITNSTDDVDYDVGFVSHFLSSGSCYGHLCLILYRHLCCLLYLCCYICFT